MTNNKKMSNAELQALKVAFSYMPKAMDVTRYEYGDRHSVILEHIELVREMLYLNDVDPDEVHGEINDDIAPNSTY